MAECSIEGDELRAFRVRGLRLSLRACWTALPILIVALVFWRPEFVLLVAIPAVVTLAASYSAMRWFTEMRMPAHERFLVDGDALIREVGGAEKTRVHYSRMKAIFCNRHAMVVNGEASIVIPVKSEGFASIAEALSKWGDTQTPSSILNDMLSAGVGILILALASATALYLSYHNDMFRWFALGVFAGLVLAEVTWRVAAAWAKQTRPTTF